MRNNTNQTKTLIVVSIVWMPVVAKRSTTVLCIVVPRAAANNTMTAILPGDPTHKGSTIVSEIRLKKFIRRYASEQWFSAQLISVQEWKKQYETNENPESSYD